METYRDRLIALAAPGACLTSSVIGTTDKEPELRAQTLPLTGLSLGLVMTACESAVAIPVIPPEDFECAINEGPIDEIPNADTLRATFARRGDVNVCVWWTGMDHGDRKALVVRNGRIEDVPWPRSIAANGVEELDIRLWVLADPAVDCSHPSLAWPSEGEMDAGDAAQCGRNRCCGADVCVSYHLTREANGITTRIAGLYQGCPAGDDACFGPDGAACEWSLPDTECAEASTTACALLHRGECATGRADCVDGRWQGCPPPRAERCNELDDDCDGGFDEADGRCTAGIGACRREGQMQCNDRQERVCSVLAGDPTPEHCDRIDNDCNGRVDDLPGRGERCVQGVGACQGSGVRECLGDEQLTCTAIARLRMDEVPCNTVDDDCDGRIDEFEAPDCVVGVGVCARDGHLACNEEGAFCLAVEGPSHPEVCDGVDNDCDGKLDECSIINGRGECRDGACVITSCRPYWSDRDRRVDTGCESNPLEEGMGDFGRPAAP